MRAQTASLPPMQGVAVARPAPVTDPRRDASLVSVVVPVFEEEAVIEQLCARTAAALAGVAWELILVDDGSRDRTPELLQRLARDESRIGVVTLSRNFGHQMALTAGLDHAAGDVVVTMDADLQDPPEVIPALLDRWRAGADVVYAVREQRAGETRMKLLTAGWFYRLFRRVTRIELAAEAADFRLLDRRALDALGSMRERNRFLRGMSVWVGFTQATVPYRREPRLAGTSKYTTRRMVRFAFDALFSFSNLPLQLATVLGFVCAGLAILGLPLAGVARSAGILAHGMGTVLFVVLLLGGIQLITVGIIGEYVGRIYDEVKGRPLYVVARRSNVTEPSRRAMTSAEERSTEEDRVSV